MKNLIILIVLLFTAQLAYTQELGQYLSALFSRDVVVKRKTADTICDTCKVDYVFTAEPEFSYVITGTRRTPQRFREARRNFISPVSEPALQSFVFFISQRNIGINFLPNFLQEKGKRIQIYRSYGGEDYNNLEFKAEQNGKVVRSWTRLSNLRGDKDHAILSEKQLSGKTVLMPWNGSVFAGNFSLNVKDTLNITVRTLSTGKVIQSITIFRAEDKATNFIYYQVPVSSRQFALNLQNILNTSSDIGEEDVLNGDSVSVFQKDHASVGLLRFLGVNGDDVIQYSFGNKPYAWQSVRSQEYERGIFIVLGNDMEAGRDHDLYLRYKSQPETVHKIVLRVKEKPLVIPWGMIAVISVLMMIAGATGFYLWEKRNKEKLAALKRKNNDIEARLALLSGQLNPHFLFNSLHAIQGTINSGDPGRANTYIGNVANFMRDVMDNGRKEFVSLEEELKIEEEYLKLEQERMAFSYAIIVAPDLEPSLIDFPPLLLQPILENSIRHAFGADLAEPEIIIKISSDHASLYIEVSDNGNTSWDVAALRNGHGLSITKKRMAVYNEKLEAMCMQMQINYEPGRGTVTTFSFQNWLA